MGFFKKLASKPFRFGAIGLARQLFKKPSGPSPSEAAMGYLNQIPGATQPYYQPFIESGQQAAGMVNPIYEQMSQNPNAFIEQLMQNYTPSKGYQFKQGEMEKAMRNAAAHGGFVGTPYNQQQQAELTQGMLSEDMQQFLNNLMGAQETGLRGQEGRIKRGYEASTGYGDILGGTLGTQGTYAYRGAQDLRDMNQARRQGRMQFIPNLIASFYGMGGKGGAMGGGSMGGSYGGYGGGYR